MAENPPERARRSGRGAAATGALLALLAGAATADAQGRGPAARGRPSPLPPALVEPGPLPPLPGDPALPGEFRRVPDTTGLIPDHPPGPPAPRPVGAVARQVGGLFEMVQDPEAEINVALGRSKLLVVARDRPISRIAIARPDIADVRVLDEPKFINLYGLRFGATTMTIFYDDPNPNLPPDDRSVPVTFLVRVTIDTRDLQQRLRQLYPAADIRISQVGSQVILDGQVPDAKTMQEVLQLVNNELSGGAEGPGGGPVGPVGADARPTAPRDDGLERTALTRQGPGPATIAGPVGAPEGPEAGAEPVPGAIVPAAAPPGGGLPAGTIVNRVKVPGPRQIMLHVKIAELNRSALRQLGISTLIPGARAIVGTPIGGAGVFNATALTTGTVGAPFGSAATALVTNSGVGSQLYGIFGAGQFNIFLNALRLNSLAKVLAEPNLMTLDGQPAHFLAGGKYPFPVPQASTFGGPVITYQFRDFGAILQFLPHILENDQIRLDVTPVFSTLNFSTGAVNPTTGLQVPSINERSARTVVQLREGQTLAIAGLLQTTTNASTARIPFLGDLPVVGDLFSKSSIETVETELVVLVTPELVAPVERCDVPPAPGDRVFEPNDCEFYALGRIEGKTGRPFRATVHELDPFNWMRHARSANRWVVGPHGHAD